MKNNDMEAQLTALANEDNLRSLSHLEVQGRHIVHEGVAYLNLASNDYMGVTSQPWYRDFMVRAVADDTFLLSNPSSRLMTGNSADYEQLEQAIERLYGDELRAMVLSSGYLVNAGVLPALTGKNDLILADKLVHASLIDGIRLSEAPWKRFPHNDMQALERMLQQADNVVGTVWVVTESIFSMDGDRAPMRELAALKKKYDFKLYVDEAHAFGVCGEAGCGVASEQGVESACDVRVATLGKAVASQGAFVLTDTLTYNYLVNRLRTLIFSTALPPLSLRWSAEVIGRLPAMEAERERLRMYVRQLTGREDASHIIPIMAGENSRAIALSRQFREAGYWAMPIRTPTVPVGSARVRISLTAALTPDEVQKIVMLCKNIG